MLSMPNSPLYLPAIYNSTTEFCSWFGQQFAPSNNPTFAGGVSVGGTLTVTGQSNLSNRLIVSADGIGVSIRASPPANGGESSIGFYRNTNLSGNTGGDQWVMGHNSWQVGAGNFAIGTLGRGECISIASASGAVNAVHSLTIAGRPAATKPWVAGRCAPGAGGTIFSSSGQQSDFSVTRNGDGTVGQWRVSWSAGHPSGSDYGVLITVGGTPVHWSYTSVSATSFQLSFYNLSNSLADPSEFTFMTIP
jgi:hypothetical protein